MRFSSKGVPLAASALDVREKANTPAKLTVLKGRAQKLTAKTDAMRE